MNLPCMACLSGIKQYEKSQSQTLCLSVFLQCFNQQFWFGSFHTKPKCYHLFSVIHHLPSIMFKGLGEQGKGEREESISFLSAALQPAVMQNKQTYF